MSPQHDLGPVLPPRSLVYDRAHEIAALAAIACDCASTGPGGDLVRAVVLLGRIAVLAGIGEPVLDQRTLRDPPVPLHHASHGPPPRSGED